MLCVCINHAVLAVLAYLRTHGDMRHKIAMFLKSTNFFLLTPYEFLKNSPHHCLVYLWVRNGIKETPFGVVSEDDAPEFLSF